MLYARKLWVLAFYCAKFHENFEILWNFYMKAIIYASTEYWTFMRANLLLPGFVLVGFLNHWRQVDLCDFKRQESICTRVKHSAELFLQFVRLLYSTFTKTAIKSK